MSKQQQQYKLRHALRSIQTPLFCALAREDLRVSSISGMHAFSAWLKPGLRDACLTQAVCKLQPVNMGAEIKTAMPAVSVSPALFKRE